MKRHLTLLLAGLTFTCLSSAQPLSQQEGVNDFIQHMVKTHQFEPSSLTKLLDQSESQPRILELIAKPYESKPWHEYRKLFVNDARAQQGAEFWQKHQKTLAEVSERYGVAPQYIVAILGVETRYGQNTGSYRVMDALTTLGFGYPKRSTFFKKQLEEYLVLTRQEGIDPFSVKGSYAGAIGLAQFIPSSYRHYAVDFDGDGQRHLLKSPADAIASIANYFKEHGWLTQQPVAEPARVQGEAFEPYIDNMTLPKHTLKTLKVRGVKPAGNHPDTTPATLMQFEIETGKEYWVGFTNFYVITRYNHSPRYAMAVHQLSQAIAEKFHAM